MGAQLPPGDPAPEDGALPRQVAAGAEGRDFGLYVHVPFCRVRCGYCDFNTYTADELRGARRDEFWQHAVAELALAQRVLHDAGMPRRPLASVFFGGGTPTILPPDHLARILHAARDAWGLAPGAEVTTEANPDTVTPASLRALATAGFTRVSFGMQSAVPRVLATLDRTHDPERIPSVVQWARDAGLQVSLDLIYGTPGETLDDWRRSLDAALACDPDHLSAYALIVEDGTALARRIRRGELPEPDDDLEADMYELADATLADAGYAWYELSNWARAGHPDHRSTHNRNYWLSQDWWGVGPGAHSHVGGVRWWNVKHPAAYRDRLAAHASPALARETLSPQTRYEETVLLRSRLAEGIPLADLEPLGRGRVPQLIADGLADGAAAVDARSPSLRLTLRGRLLADAVVRDLLIPDA